MTNKKMLDQRVMRVLVFGLIIALIFPYSVSAKKQKKGAKVVITKTDATKIKGELFRVKDHAIVVKSHEGEGLSIPVKDISQIMVIKSKFKKGAVPGGIIGILAGAGMLILVASVEEDTTFNVPTIFVVCAIPAVVLGGVGGLISMAVLKDKRYDLQGQPENEIKAILNILRKKARFKD